MLLQLTLGLAIPIANATTDGSFAEPDPNSSKNTQGQQNTTSPQQSTADPKSFSVTKYLSAPGQEQSYLAKDKNSAIASFIIQIINFLVFTIGSLSFVTLVIGGFTLMASNGNESLVNKGKEMIKYGITGLVIVLSAYLIVSFVQSLFYELPKK